jgi:hypothetical protein
MTLHLIEMFFAAKRQLSFLVVIFLVVFPPRGAFGSSQDQVDYGKQINVLIKNAQGDQKTVKRLTNLKYGLSVLKPSDLSGIKCGKDQSPSLIDVDKASDIIGTLLGKGLEKYLPTLAAALASAPATGVVAFLTPTAIAEDSVEILNQSNTRSQNQVQNAARQVLQDTLPDSFKKLNRSLMSKAIACTM